MTYFCISAPLLLLQFKVVLCCTGGSSYQPLLARAQSSGQGMYANGIDAMSVSLFFLSVNMYLIIFKLNYNNYNFVKH